MSGADDWLPGARRVISPHADARPERAVPQLVVIHGISLPPGEFGRPWIEDLFCGRLDPNAHPYFAALQGLRVSAHLLIGRGGEVTQFVPLSARAWHAGVSCWRGRPACNDFSIGIELEGTDDQPYAEPQYQQLAAALDWLATRYPWPLDLAGHADIAPGRKTDPGPAFDWDGLSRRLADRNRFVIRDPPGKCSQGKC